MNKSIDFLRAKHKQQNEEIEALKEQNKRLRKIINDQKGESNSLQKQQKWI